MNLNRFMICTFASICFLLTLSGCGEKENQVIVDPEMTMEQEQAANAAYDEEQKALESDYQ